MKNKASKLIKILTKKKLNISFAESCTGGLLSSTITSISGSSKVFAIGLLTYSNQSKISVLKVPKNTIIKYINGELGTNELYKYRVLGIFYNLDNLHKVVFKVAIDLMKSN